MEFKDAARQLRNVQSRQWRRLSGAEIDALEFAINAMGKLGDLERRAREKEIVPPPVDKTPPDLWITYWERCAKWR